MIKTLIFYIKKDKIRKETFWALCTKGISVFAGLFLIFFIPKYFGIENYGKFSLLLAYISIFEIFFGNSINAVIKKDLATHKFTELGGYSFLHGFKIKLSFYLIGVILAYLIIKLLKITLLDLYFLPFIVLLFLMNFWGLVINCFEASHRLVYTTLMYVLEYVITIGLLLSCFIEKKFAFECILFSFIIGYSISFIFGLFLLLNKFQGRLKVHIFSFFEKLKFEQTLRSTLSMSLASASYILLTRVDSVMLSKMASLQDVGFYNIAAEITRNASIVGMAIILGIIPLFINSGQMVLFKKTVLKLLIVNILILFGVLFFSEKFVHFLYGDGFEAITKLTRILAPYPLLISLQALTSEIMIIKDCGAVLFKTGFIAVVFNVVLNYLLIKLLGVSGAALATLLSYGVWFILNYYYLKKIL